MARRAPLPRDTRVAIEELDAKGAGLGAAGGYRLRVHGALPGEAVTVRVVRRRHGRLEAVAETVARPHEDRMTPECPHAGVCGGCALQHLAPDAQRAGKRARLALLLDAAGAPAPERWLPDVTGPTRGYRRKARLGVRHVPGKGGVLVGFRERGSSRVADVEACRVLAPEIGERLGALRALLGRLSVAASIPQLEIAVGDAAAAVIVRHLEPLPEGDLDLLREGFREMGLQLWLQPAGPDSVHRVLPTAGPERLHQTLPESGLRFAFHPLDFVQVNPFVNRQMVSRAVELLAPERSDRVLDLFCGSGNFTLPLAARSGEVHGMEGSEVLVERARENAAANAIDNVSFEAADLYAADFETAALPRSDLLLLDPPRSGAERVCAGIGAVAPRRIVYVSCDPETLARDAALLAGAGYRLEAAGILDMFPHTAHVESMALFRAR